MGAGLPKTAFVAHWFPKPSETFVFREIRGLQRRGLPLLVFSLYGPLRKNLSAEMAANRLPVERLGLGYLPHVPRELNRWRRRCPGLVELTARVVLKNRWRDLEMCGENVWALLAGFRLARRCAEERVGHIHAAWASGPATSAWTASRLTGIPFSFSARAVDIYPPDGALARKIEAASFVRTESRAVPNYLVGRAPGCRDKIFTVHSPLTLGRDKKAEVLFKPPYRLLAVGRLVRKKGFEFLLRACALLARQGWDFRLDLVGWGPEGGRLVSLAARLGLEDRVDFPGFVTHDRVASYYNKADLFIMPSLILPKGDRDGLPNALVEAMSHGLPVVATDVCGIGEVVVNGETGVLIPRAVPKDLARAAAFLLGDRERALGMAEKGRALVNSLFDPALNADRLIELFKAHSGAGEGPGRG